MTHTELRKSRVSTQERYELGSVLADHFRPLFLDRIGYADSAIATCIVTVMGRNAHAHNGTSPRVGNFMPHRSMIATQTRMQSFGLLPTRRFKLNGRFARSHSFQGANDVLECFDLCIGDIFLHYGLPLPDQHYDLYLVDIIKELRPELLQPKTQPVADSVQL